MYLNITYFIMNLIKKLLYCITLCANFIGYAQNIDWVNAPVNPVPQGCNLNKTELKGDVFQATRQYYDKLGNQIFFNPNEYVTKDHLDRIVSYTSPTLGTTEYKYDSKGNLVYSGGILYEYDSNNRLVKRIQGEMIRTYAYEKQGDILIVFNYEHSKAGELVLKGEDHYKNGLIVRRIDKKRQEEIIYTYEFDIQGNWTKRFYTDANGNPIRNPFNQVIIYHKEFENFDAKVTVKNTSGNINLKSNIYLPHLVLNSKLVNLPLTFNFSNDYVFYNPLTNNYFIAPNAFDKSLPKNAIIPHKPLLQGENNILLIKGNETLLIKDGLNYKRNDIPNNWRYKKYFNHILINNEQEMFFAENAMLKTSSETRAFPVFSMTSKGNEIWYVPSKDKKKITLYEKGKEINGFKVFGFIEGTQDYVLGFNNTPSYVLSNYNLSKPENFNRGRYFNSSVDTIGKENSSNQSENNVEDTSCTSGNCTDGYGTYAFKSGAKVEGFFKNGKLHGYAQFVYANGDTYNGNYYEGQRNGYGIYYWKQSNLHYYGHWKDTKQHGYGYFVKNGETVEAGIYTDSQLTTNLFADYLSQKTNGNCLGDCANGYGSITYNQGDVYEGFFKNGQPYKAGSYMWTDGKSYMGDWDDKGKINYTGQFFTDTFVYKGAFAHNGYITGLGVKLDKKTNIKTYGEFKAGKLILDYAKKTKPKDNTTAPSKIVEDALQSLAKLYVSTYKVDNANFKPMVIKDHNNMIAKQPVDRVNQSHANFIRRLFLLDKQVAYRYLLYLPNPYARKNTSKIIELLSNEERTYFVNESKRITSQYKLKKEYEPKN